MPPEDGFRHEYAQVNGLRYHYVREGSGPPLVLVHGWPGFYYEWRLNIRPLAEHFDVIVPDMRGYAYTDKPDVLPEVGYTPAVFADDIAGLLDALGFERASFVTHDFGAAWVQAFARNYKDRVDKLVMFNPPYPGIGMRWLEVSHVREVWYQMFHQLDWAEDLVGSSREATRLYVQHFLSHWSHNKSIWTPEEIDVFVDAYSQPGALRGGFNCYRAVYRTIGQGGGGDPKVYQPTLILWGEGDAVLPIAWSDKLSDFFPNLTFRKVPEAGHWIMREKPDLVNAAIIEFVKEPPMKVETAFVAPSIEGYAEGAKRMEAAGYDAVVVPEAGHDPFLPLMTIAEHTKIMHFGTAVAIAFPRSPMVTAQIAWDLQRFSGGRFILGLGTQVKGHNERRYSTSWPSPPGPRLKDYILCLKAIFNTFQTNARPDYHGKSYEFSLISPFFNPGPNDPPHVPIYISAVNAYNCRLVGEVCDGIRMHGFNTPKYTEEVIIPAIKKGAAKAGRKFEDIDIVGGTFVITGDTEEEVEKAKAPVRQQLSFYASTRAYHPVLEVHGWQDVGDQLFRLSMEGKWADMAKGLTDEMLEQFAVIGTYDELVPKIRDRYKGVVTTIDFGFGVRTPEQQERLAHIVEELKAI